MIARNNRLYFSHKAYSCLERLSYPEGVNLRVNNFSASGQCLLLDIIFSVKTRNQEIDPGFEWLDLEFWKYGKETENLGAI